MIGVAIGCMTLLAATFGQVGMRESTRVAEDDARESMSAADVLKALQRSRPKNHVIPPVGKTYPVEKSDEGLLPEGFPLVNVSGTIRQADGWWVMQFEDREGLPPLRVLPNAALEPMARTARTGGASTVFTVSGEVTEFADENFLLVQLVSRKPTGASRQAPTGIPSAPGSEGPGANGTSTSGNDTSGQRPASDGDVGDVMAALRAQSPTIDPISIVANAPAAAPAEGTMPDVRFEGEPMVAKPGRLIRSGEWWTLVFDSDRRDDADRPIRVLPNQHLERMVSAIEQDASGVVFLVTGRVTVYRGENYLLARSVQRQVNSGNLRR